MSSRLPGWLPQEIYRTGIFTVSDVAVVMSLFFGHLDGEEKVASDIGGDSASVMADPRSRSGCQA
jgi:hypothetical protein